MTLSPTVTEEQEQVACLSVGSLVPPASVCCEQRLPGLESEGRGVGSPWTWEGEESTLRVPRGWLGCWHVHLPGPCRPPCPSRGAPSSPGGHRPTNSILRAQELGGAWRAIALRGEFLSLPWAQSSLGGSS